MEVIIVLKIIKMLKQIDLWMKENGINQGESIRWKL